LNPGVRGSARSSLGACFQLDQLPEAAEFVLQVEAKTSPTKPHTKVFKVMDLRMAIFAASSRGERPLSDP
jgi:hypothetical protein